VVVPPTRGSLTGDRPQPHDLYIGRGCEKLGLPRSEWHNPFKISRKRTRAQALEEFRAYSSEQLVTKLPLLSGRRLVCHCLRHQACHGDVVIELFKLHASSRQGSCSSAPSACCVDGATSASLVVEATTAAAPGAKQPDLDSAASPANSPEQATLSSDAQTEGEACNFAAVSREPLAPSAARKPTRERVALRFLLLFAGPRRTGSVKDWLLKLGSEIGAAVEVDDFDLVNGPQHDLMDDYVWRKVLEKVKSNSYSGVLLSPPCSTFGCRRADQGPRPLRGTTGPERYGRKDLTASEAEKAKIGTTCATLAAECAWQASQAGVPWLLEQPAAIPDRPHMLLLDEWSQAFKAATSRADVDQCMFGADFVKPTLLIGTVDVKSLAQTCVHEPRWWR